MISARRRLTLWLAGVVLTGLSLPGPAAAQTAAPAMSAGAGAARRAGVEMASRDAEGRLVIRAQRLPERLVLDGRLNESVYTDYQPVTGFLQSEPQFDEPATEQTEVWVFFDDNAVYVGVRCYDSQPDRWSSLDMRRDSLQFSRAEGVSLAFDTFLDRRNGLIFGANPAGGITDMAISNERDSNRDWNTIWDSRTARFDGGWTIEYAIPFKSLRYAPGEQTWGFNVRRVVKWKNEVSYLNQVPLGQFSARAGIFRFSSAATLVGIVAPPESRVFEVKPYGISSLKTNKAADVPFTNRAAGSLGFDTKVGVTQGLTADFTYNTDFAQVEDDEQQVNLTRFSLFFPEKREFFLEGQGIFAFGGYAQRRVADPGEMPLPFFSRRIGLDDDGNAVPILGGGRLTGRVGKYSVGVVNIQTKQDAATGNPETNFSVVRVRRDILKRSTIGLVAVNRSAYESKLRANQTYGVDGVFSFYENVNINTFYARTRTPELTGDEGAYRAQFEYNADRYGLVYERMSVGESFNPEAGYVRRHDFVRNMAQLRFSPRPRNSRVIRKFDYAVSVDRFVGRRDGILETGLADATFGIEFQSSDALTVQILNDRETITEAFTVFGRVQIPVGTFRFTNVHAEYELGSQHWFSGTVGYDQGGFYGGSKKTVSLAAARVEPVANLFVEPGVSLNFVDLPQGTFTARVLTSRVFYTFTPRTFVSALLQYNSNSHTVSVNARLRWEYRPGSDLFVVYSDGRDTLERGFPRLQTRSFTIKVTRFFRL